MSYPVVDDPLSNNTARLSISQIDVEEENPRSRVKELLTNNETYPLERISSAISLESVAEDDENTLNSKNDSKSSPKKILKQKRRRSSNQSLNSNTPPVKKEKKLHKKKLKKQWGIPSIEFQPTKEHINNENSKRFPLRNIRSLILHIFNVPTGQGIKWCKTQNIEKIKNVVIVSVNGLDIEPTDINETNSKNTIQKVPIQNLNLNEELSFFKETFAEAIQCMSPGGKDSIYQTLDSICNIPLSKNERKVILEQSKREKITIKDLLLDESQLKLYDYPITKEDDSWSETITPIDETRDSKIFALDCEFCKAGNLQVLTRISLIDFEGQVVFDKLVKPEQEITDYVTKYSGITEELLKDVTATIQDIQLLFLSTVFKYDILVGHSLESDLKVMKIIHKNIVDTAVIYEHNRGPPSKPSLRWLASNFLARDIQLGEDNGKGHSSIEDSITCLDLVKLKIIEGKRFGTNLNEMSIFEKLHKTKNILHNQDYFLQNTFQSIILAHDKTLESCTTSDYVIKYDVNDDEKLIQYYNECLLKIPEFLVIQLKDLEYNLKWSIPSKNYNGELDYDINESKKRINSKLANIYERLPTNTLFLVFSQSKDPTRMNNLQKIKNKFQYLERNDKLDLEKLSKEEIWDQDKADELYNATSLARESLLFMNVKTENENS
ncbi:uncharacterized protein KGF55_001810 [Candida pseudojiufengensis]|uniref:uncharacterized protein n=1 Tax=Candida pseudojiufengensis TaxID=497109 RepID=UPI00222462F4|nr:uncharacterized protein KGF55_001810 [Candida pseudojiufengensis]KAI5964740.1 hypothetical protein KGF55_001810 [Candida pseudojiufengensis]